MKRDSAKHWVGALPVVLLLLGACAARGVSAAEADRIAEVLGIEAGMRVVEQRIEKDMDPFVSGRNMDTDEVIFFSELREWLEVFVEMAYQNHGSRRVKNPRIWSLHDLRVLTD